MERDRNRLAEVFEREKSRFLGYVRRQIADLSGVDAEDILSEVTYRLLRRADLVEEVENLTAYIYRALANRIVDHQRSGRPSVSLDQEQARQPDSQALRHDGPSPEQHYHQTQLRDQLRLAIGALGPKERAVWVATELEGRTFRDLAEDWGEPIGTLLSRKSRATARLRSHLSEYASQP